MTYGSAGKGKCPSFTIKNSHPKNKAKPRTSEHP